MSDGIQFFGNIDRVHGDDRKGFASAYPVSYFKQQVEALKNDIEDSEMRLRDDRVPVTDIHKAKVELKKKKEKMDAIEQSIPKVSGKQKDELSKHYKDLSEKIRDAMPTRSDMMMGLADVHSEVRAMTKPCISVKGMEFLRDMGIRPVNGKITRNEASRAFKIIGNVLGEHTNVERLRRDRSGGTFKNERSVYEIAGA